jgi:hypothetical protein
MFRLQIARIAHTLKLQRRSGGADQAEGNFQCERNKPAKAGDDNLASRSSDHPHMRRSADRHLASPR